uniref:Secreted protein n=1 Tax=Macrostomum lignano TaxID=282301 RepID=A0A1I8FQ52_9PLAT
MATCTRARRWTSALTSWPRCKRLANRCSDSCARRSARRWPSCDWVAWSPAAAPAPTRSTANRRTLATCCTTAAAINHLPHRQPQRQSRRTPRHSSAKARRQRNLWKRPTSSCGTTRWCCRSSALAAPRPATMERASGALSTWWPTCSNYSQPARLRRSEQLLSSGRASSAG